MFNMNPTEIVLILLVILILFGGKKIPELARGLGKGIKEFKDAVKDGKDTASKAMEDDTPNKN
jgi:sec-independent protein translocase protein TatA